MGDDITRTVKLGDETVTIQPFSPRKALRVVEIVRSLGSGWDEIVSEAGAFARRWEQSNTIELSRAEAQMRNAPRPALDDDGNVVRDEHGEVVLIPGRLSHLTEEDWAQSGQKLVMRPLNGPPDGLVQAYVTQQLVARFEEPVTRMLALVLVSNQQLGDAIETGDDEALEKAIAEKRRLLLDRATLGELVRFAVCAFEAVKAEMFAEVEDLGGERVGNALGLLGIDLAGLGIDLSTSSKPTSSSSSPTSSDGESDGPSTASPGDEPAS